MKYLKRSILKQNALILQAPVDPLVLLVLVRMGPLDLLVNLVEQVPRDQADNLERLVSVEKQAVPVLQGFLVNVANLV